MTRYSAYSDQELTDLLRSGDHSAFTEIYNRYKVILHIHAYKKLGDAEEAKDVIQEVFSTVWNRHDSIPETVNLSGYLYTAVRNRILNLIAHKKIESGYVTSFNVFAAENSYTADTLIRERELAVAIEREINALAPKMREVFLLSRRMHLSHKEIAIKLCVSEHTVKNQMKSALKLLRVRLGILLYLILLFWF